MTDNVKPVPCGCGGEAIIGLKEWEDRKGNYHENSFVYCDNCSISTGGYLTEAEAIEAWNRAMGERTAKVETYTDDQQETWSVCECGTDVWKSYNYCPECGAKLDWGEHE